MPVFVGLLRAINVGGTGMLAMKELAGLCTGIGFENVRTYIQSGNVIFESELTEKRIQAELERMLAERMGKKIDVMVRTAAELRAILDANPFPDREPAKVAVLFSSKTIPKELIDELKAPGGEQLHAGKREIYIYYPVGLGKSKLRLPAKLGALTARNINTVGKLAALAAT
jgi:uncharacterized protein (DUF1697 family)